MNTLDLIRETAENARKYYAEAREYFQKEFVNGPGHAIKWHAECVVAAEYTYDFWAFVKAEAEQAGIEQALAAAEFRISDTMKSFFGSVSISQWQNAASREQAETAYKQANHLAALRKHFQSEQSSKG